LVAGGHNPVLPNQTDGVKRLDLNTAEELRRLPHPAEYPVYRVAYSSDGKYVLTNHRKYDFGPLPIADLAMGKITDGPPLGEAIKWPGNVAVFSPDSKLLALGRESGDLKNKTWIELWNTTTWEKVAIVEGHTGRISALAFSADGKFLVSGSEDTSALVWDVSKTSN